MVRRAHCPSAGAIANLRYLETDEVVRALDRQTALTWVERIKAKAQILCNKQYTPTIQAYQNLLQAELWYARAILLLSSIGVVDAVLFANRAIVRLQLSASFPDRAEQALSDANRCLELDPHCIKGYQRKAQILIKLRQWDFAIQLARQGLELDPQNEAFADLVAQAEMNKKGWTSVPQAFPTQPFWLPEAQQNCCSARTLIAVRSTAKIALNFVGDPQVLPCWVGIFKAELQQAMNRFNT